jgi:hypothetical protein
MQPIFSGFFLLLSERVIIFPERIDPGKKQEQRHESNHDKRDEAGACRFSHGAVRLTRGIPVRDYLTGKHRVRGERGEDGEEEAGDDCYPDEVYTGSWASPGNEDGCRDFAGEGLAWGMPVAEGLCR